MSRISNIIWRSGEHGDIRIALHLAQIFESLPGGKKSHWKNEESKAWAFDEMDRTGFSHSLNHELNAWKNRSLMNGWIIQQNTGKELAAGASNSEAIMVAESPARGEIAETIKSAIHLTGPTVGLARLSRNPSNAIGVRTYASKRLVWKLDDWWGVYFGRAGSLHAAGQVLTHVCWQSSGYATSVGIVLTDDIPVRNK